MPLTTRAISPVDLSVHRLNSNIQRDELQCVANGTMANLIRQLSSLSRNAEQLFSEVHREVLKIDHKTNTLFLRVERLAQKVQQPDLNRTESASLEENHMRKAFRSTNIIDQHSLDRQTLPNTLLELYQRCDPPPDLNQFNPYRDNPKQNALSLYTDPSYFFDLWKQEMLKDIGRTARPTARSPMDGAASKSPSRGARRQRQQKMVLHCQPSNHQQAAPPIYQSNVLLRHTTGTYVDAGRATYSTSHNRNLPSGQQQQLRFPDEYQAPQNLINTSTRIHAPHGMSLHATEVRNGQNSNRNADLFIQQQQNIYQQNQRQVEQQHQNILMGPEHSSNVIISQQQRNQAPPTGIDSHYLSNEEKMGNRFEDMSLQHAQQQNYKSQTQDASAMQSQQIPNFGGFLEEDEDDELPPPPPVLSTHTKTMMSTAGNSSSMEGFHLSNNEIQKVVSQHQQQALQYTGENNDNGNNDVSGVASSQNQRFTDAMQFVPSGNIISSEQHQNIPPAPPPPPPPPAPVLGDASRSGSFAQNGKTDSDGSQLVVSDCPQKSALLMDIKKGKELRRVEKQAELAQQRDTNDVASILRRRMEQLAIVMTGDDDDEESNGDDGEWDD